MFVLAFGEYTGAGPGRVGNLEGASIAGRYTCGAGLVSKADAGGALRWRTGGALAGRYAGGGAGHLGCKGVGGPETARFRPERLALLTCREMAANADGDEGSGALAYGAKVCLGWGGVRRELFPQMCPPRPELTGLFSSTPCR